MKRKKIFPAIIYFIFTFMVGLFLGIFLPALYLFNGVLTDTIDKELAAGNYVSAMELFSDCYFNESYVYQNKIGSGGIVIFESAILDEKSLGSNENSAQSGSQSADKSTSDAQNKTTVISKAYMVFLHGVKNSYNVSGKNSLAKAVVTANGEQKVTPVLITDTDGDGIADSVATMLTNDFLFIDLSESSYSSIEKLSFIDKDGNLFFEADFTASPLNFSTDFYNDISPLVTAVSNEESSETLLDLETQFLSKSALYKKGSIDKATKAVNKKATRTVIIYFVIIYVIADMLFTHFIIKFVKFLLVKVFKVKFKERPRVHREESFGNDYFCAVTVRLDITAIIGDSQEEGLKDYKDMPEKVMVSYGEGEATSTFILNKDNGYEATNRIKAGTYGNLQFSEFEVFKIENLPETLIVEGYKKILTPKIVRRED